MPDFSNLSSMKIVGNSLFKPIDTLACYGIYSSQSTAIPEAIKFSMNTYNRIFDYSDHAIKDRRACIELIRKHRTDDDEIIVPFLYFFSKKIDDNHSIILCDRQFFSESIKSIAEIDTELTKTLQTSDDTEQIEKEAYKYFRIPYAISLTINDVAKIIKAIEGKELLDWEKYDCGYYLGGEYLLDRYLWQVDSKIKNQYTEAQIRLLILEVLDSERTKFERLSRKFSKTICSSSLNRQQLSEEVRVFVWRRDGGKCASCGGQERLEYDHIIPVSKGGSNTERNIQLLCERCNRLKGSKIQ